MARKNTKEKLALFIKKHKLFNQWPWVTLSILTLQVLVFLMEQRAINVHVIQYILDDYSFVWDAFIENPLTEFPRLISHLFMHANSDHLLSNMVFFLIFAPVVEGRMGGKIFLFCYLFWGASAALSQGFFTPFSTGLIGASGAVSGAAGAFFVLYPLRSPPHFLAYVLGGWIRYIPAFFWIGLLFLNQLRLGLYFLLPEAMVGQVSNIGYWAHIGGYLAGALTAFPFIFIQKPENS